MIPAQIIRFLKNYKKHELCDRFCSPKLILLLAACDLVHQLCENKYNIPGVLGGGSRIFLFLFRNKLTPGVDFEPVFKKIPHFCTIYWCSRPHTTRHYLRNPYFGAGSCTPRTDHYLYDLYDLFPVHDLDLSGQIVSSSVWSVWSVWSAWSSSRRRVGAVV